MPDLTAMILRVIRPDFGAAHAVATMHTIHAAPGENVAAGAALVDLRVDMSGGVVRDCPPVSTCRIVAQEAGVVDAILLAVGDVVPAGATLLTLHGPNAGDGEGDRPARVAAASILSHDDWWDDPL